MASQEQFSSMDQELTGRSDNRKLQQRVKSLTAGLIGSAVVILALLAAVIAIGVGQASQNDRIDKLRAAMSTSASASRSTPSAPSSAMQASSDVPTSAQGLLIVDNPSTVQQGFKLAGHLFEGSGYWTPLHDMIYQRSDHAVVPVEDMVYIIGGVTDSRNKMKLLDALTAYDTQTNTMIALDPMPSPRFRFGAAMLGYKVFIMGGYTSLPNNAMPDNKEASMDIYDVKTRKWVTGAKMITGRSDCCAAEIGGKIYVVGGWDANWTTLASMEVYDPETDKWTTAASMNSPRGDLGCVALDGKLYTLGGYGNQGYEGTVEEYDPATDKWTRKNPMEHPRGDFAVVALSNGRILTMGGEIQTLGKNMTTFADVNLTQVASHRVEEYIMEHNIWVPLAPLPEARFRAAAAVVQDMVYIFGGTPTCEPDKNLPACYQVGLKSVYAYYDLARPNMYIMVKE